MLIQYFTLPNTSICCSSDDEISKASMIGGRGSGRLARRRKRIDRLRGKESAARDERQARKELVKVSSSH